VRASGRAPEVVTSRTATRVAFAGVATLILAATTAAVPTTPGPAQAAPPAVDAAQSVGVLLADRAERLANPPGTRRAAVRPVAPRTPATHARPAHKARPVLRTVVSRTIRRGRHAARSAHRTVAHVVAHTRARTVVHEAARAARNVAAGRGLGAVVAFARTKVGHRYRSGAAGPGSFDCSGLVMMAYRRIGLRLPHSAAAIAGRAHSVSRSAARPGDIVVGSGHVGIYMGGGMMIDAGNPRVGVSYRRMYAGLRVERM
jgi:cell wall-associated NlpC family hydrolase